MYFSNSSHRLKSIIAVALIFIAYANITFAEHKKSVFFAPYEVISEGPGYHWFGYYDKFQTSYDDRYFLTMKVDFDRRSPNPDDEIEVGYFDSNNDYAYTKIGTSKAWCWQQGCQLQWRPESKNEILWNDRIDGKFVTKVYNIETREFRFLPEPIYHLSPDGMWGLGVDFARLDHMRRGYGYAGIPDKNKDVLAPEDSYIYKIHLDTGEVVNLISVATVAEQYGPENGKHYFNHPQWNTDGSRFLFVHRWRVPGKGGFITRKLTLSNTGEDLRILSDEPGSSHHAWRDKDHVLMFIRNSYRLIRDDGKQEKEIIWNEGNGHQTYLENKDWVITDTYPKKNDYQRVYLRNLKTKTNIPLAEIYLPRDEYRGKEWRIDTHPRLTRKQDRVIIDAWIDEEQGRQQIILDMKHIIGNNGHKPRHKKEKHGY
ncbi:MAG: hypothetical protein ACPGN3_15385 [Opitutales bacterium]